MDKKTKLLLGIGVVGVGAYLLFKSKKATTPALSPAAPANLVGFDTGNFYDVKGGHAGVMGEGVFTNASGKKRKGSVQVGDLSGEFVNRRGSIEVGDLGGGEFVNSAGGWNPFRRKKKVGSLIIGEGYATGERGEFVTFANQPFNFSGEEFVSASGFDGEFANAGGIVEEDGLFYNRKMARRKRRGKSYVAAGPLEGEFMSFADNVGDRMISADGVGKEFFEPKTKKFTKTPPKRTFPVDREMPMPVTQPMPLNNFASVQGAGMINSFKVKGADTFVNR
jgi:hypothetical protein